MNESRLFRCVFDFTKDGLSSHKKQKLIDDFTKIRNVLVDITNPLIEQWNDEYTEPMNPLEDGLDPNYERYMIGKFRPYIDMVNESLIGTISTVKLDMSNACCDIIGIDKTDTDRKISLSIEPY